MRIIQGTVVLGKQEARTLGYPTANINYPISQPSLEPGVWTCWITVEGQKKQGIAVVGMWKLAMGQSSLEVHLLDFTKDIYGMTVEVHLGELLRPLLSFGDIEALKRQIEQDVQLAKQWFLSR